MFGTNGEIRGVIPRSVEYLFSSLAKKSNASEVAMVCSFLEIYNDQIRDLGKAYLVAMGVEQSTNVALYEKTSDIYEHLAGKRQNPYFAPAFHKGGNGGAATAVQNRPGLKEVQDEYNTMNYEVREDNEGNVFVKDLSLVPVTTMEEVMSLISTGLRVRATHETKMNATSSRSHTVFTITVLQRDKITREAVTGMLNLVDLAGSERIKKSESQGVRLKEALHINSSLTALGKVIMALDPSAENTHIPYRDSKLTRVLQNSLGGNSYTCVVAAIQPAAKYYEECLSTLQFANRCRNVQNKPRVNYVEDTEDKDRKIKKLMEELALMRNKMGGGVNGLNDYRAGIGAGGGTGDLSVGKLVALLKKLGINATVGPDGSLMVNGKRYSIDDLGLSGSSDDENSMSHSRSGGPGASGGGGGGSGDSEKTRKLIKELKEANAAHSAKAKERKAVMEEQGRELQKLSNELIKCQTSIKHLEFENSTINSERKRALDDLKDHLDASHETEINALLSTNRDIVANQQRVIDKIPNSVKEYTELLAKSEKQRVAFEAPLRVEFASHVAQLDKSRLNELANLRHQYNNWLDEKDKALSGFVQAFNEYRSKKSEQLRMAEREIVRLYDYTAQVEALLEAIEKGKYQISQKQGAKGGKSTTGVAQMTGTRPGGAAPAASSSRGFTTGGGEQQLFADDDDQEEPDFGGVVLPPGVKPINPLKVVSDVRGTEDLTLTKKIVKRHKERVKKLDQMKEDAFQKSLHFAAQTGATATGSIDSALQNQIRGLLVAKTARSSSAPGTRRAASASGRGAPVNQGSGPLPHVVPIPAYHAHPPNCTTVGGGIINTNTITNQGVPPTHPGIASSGPMSTSASMDGAGSLTGGGSTKMRNSGSVHSLPKEGSLRENSTSLRNSTAPGNMQGTNGFDKSMQTSIMVSPDVLEELEALRRMAEEEKVHYSYSCSLRVYYRL